MFPVFTNPIIVFTLCFNNSASGISLIALLGLFPGDYMPLELLLGGEVSSFPLPGLLAPGYYPSFYDLQPIVRISRVIEKFKFIILPPRN